jgi:HEAT repeat protein
MKKRLLFWVPALTVALAGAALALPSSPFYLPVYLMAGGHHDGHSTRYWINNLHDPDAAARARAIHALGAIGPQAEAAVPELADILTQDPEPKSRMEAALALSKMRPASAAAVPALAQALADKDLRVRMNAAIALTGLGAASRPAVPALITALKDETNHTNLNAFSFTIQEEAAIALGRASAGTAAGVPALTEALRTTDFVPLRHAAARALGLVGAEARPAAPLLRQMRDGGGVAAWVVEEALQRIEPESKPAP